LIRILIFGCVLIKNIKIKEKEEKEEEEEEGEKVER
jgi:hypothetical protein